MSLEGRLKEAVKSKDKEEMSEIFAEVYKKYHKLVYFCLLQNIDNSMDAEELLDDVFLSFYKAMVRTEVKNIKYYLTVSAKNLSLNHIRSRRETAYEILEQEKEPSAETAEDFLESKEFINELRSFLTEEEYFILTERSIYGRNAKEIADELGIAHSTVRMKYHRVIEKTRKRFKGDF